MHGVARPAARRRKQPSSTSTTIVGSDGATGAGQAARRRRSLILRPLARLDGLVASEGGILTPYTVPAYHAKIN